MINVEDLIRQSEAQFRSHTVDKEAFKARFFTRLAKENQLSSTPRTSDIRPNRSRSTHFGQFAAAGLGLALASVAVAVVIRNPAVDRQPASRLTFFGVESPFQPVLPAKLLPGYQLQSSAWFMSFHNNTTHFVQYEAQYHKAGPISRDQPLSIYELPGDRVTIKQKAGIPASGVRWQKSVRINDVTFYLSNTWQSQVGFVKNHVVYVLSMPTKNMVPSLLKCAESMSIVAPVKWWQRSAETYKDALGNVSFRPVIPRLPSKFLNVGTGSQVINNGNTTSELFVLDYQIRNESQKSIQVTEGPSGKVPQNATMDGMVVGWTDKRLGIEFTVQRNGYVTKTELQEVVDTLKTSSAREYNKR